MRDRLFVGLAALATRHAAALVFGAHWVSPPLATGQRFVTHDIAEAIALGDRTLVFARAPARVHGEHAIPLPRPRDVARIYSVDGFADLHGAIRKELA